MSSKSWSTSSSSLQYLGGGELKQLLCVQDELLGGKGRAGNDHNHHHDYDGNFDNNNDDAGPADVIEAVNEDRRQRPWIKAFEQLQKNLWLRRKLSRYYED